MHEGQRDKSAELTVHTTGCNSDYILHCDSIAIEWSSSDKDAASWSLLKAPSRCTNTREMRVTFSLPTESTLIEGMSVMCAFTQSFLNTHYESRFADIHISIHPTMQSTSSVAPCCPHAPMHEVFPFSHVHDQIVKMYDMRREEMIKCINLIMSSSDVGIISSPKKTGKHTRAIHTTPMTLHDT